MTNKYLEKIAEEAKRRIIVAGPNKVYVSTSLAKDMEKKKTEEKK